MTLRGAPDHDRVCPSSTLPSDRIWQAGINIYPRPPVACSVRGTPERRAAVGWGEEFFKVRCRLRGRRWKVTYSVCMGTGLPAIQANNRHRECATYNLLSVEADNVA